MKHVKNVENIYLCMEPVTDTIRDKIILNCTSDTNYTESVRKDSDIELTAS